MGNQTQEEKTLYMRTWRENNPKKCIANRDRYWAKLNQSTRYEARPYLATRFLPGRKRAWNAVYYAVRTGALVRPNSCSRCLAECTPQAHHHNGYDNPLDVVWLCRSCHIDVDKSTRRCKWLITKEGIEK